MTASVLTFACVHVLRNLCWRQCSVFAPSTAEMERKHSPVRRKQSVVSNLENVGHIQHTKKWRKPTRNYSDSLDGIVITRLWTINMNTCKYTQDRPRNKKHIMNLFFFVHLLTVDVMHRITSMTNARRKYTFPHTHQKWQKIRILWNIQYSQRMPYCRCYFWCYSFFKIFFYS